MIALLWMEKKIPDQQLREAILSILPEKVSKVHIGEEGRICYDEINMNESYIICETYKYHGDFEVYLQICAIKASYLGLKIPFKDIEDDFRKCDDFFCRNLSNTLGLKCLTFTEEGHQIYYLYLPHESRQLVYAGDDIAEDDDDESFIYIYGRLPDNYLELRKSLPYDDILKYSSD